VAKYKLTNILFYRNLMYLTKLTQTFPEVELLKKFCFLVKTENSYQYYLKTHMLPIQETIDPDI